MSCQLVRANADKNDAASAAHSFAARRLEQESVNGIAEDVRVALLKAIEYGAAHYLLKPVDCSARAQIVAEGAG